MFSMPEDMEDYCIVGCVPYKIFFRPTQLQLDVVEVIRKHAAIME
jgi:hypothetical protein